MKIILGIDPGLVKTGWGIISVRGSELRFIGCGTIKPDTSLPLAERLRVLNQSLRTVIQEHAPTEAAIEETFVTANGASTLKLGQARGALLLTLAQENLPVSEYAATLVKKTVTGVGRAEKSQMGMMVKTLLPQAKDLLQTAGEDALDALAVAICHSHTNVKIAV